MGRDKEREKETELTVIQRPTDRGMGNESELTDVHSKEEQKANSGDGILPLTLPLS